MAVDKNIGGFANVIENANKVSALINTQPMGDPDLQFTDYNSVRASDNEDPFSHGYFIWGVSKWGSADKLVTG